MTTITQRAEQLGWLHPHWDEYKAEVQGFSYLRGLEYQARCGCGWGSMLYVNDLDGACQALWAHYLNPTHQWASDSRWMKGRKWS